MFGSASGSDSQLCCWETEPAAASLPQPSTQARAEGESREPLTERHRSKLRVEERTECSVGFDRSVLTADAAGDRSSIGLMVHPPM